MEGFGAAEREEDVERGSGECMDALDVGCSEQPGSFGNEDFVAL